MEFKPAQCPSCSGALQVPDDRTTVQCMYCGGVVIVREAIKAAAAASVPNMLMLARSAAKSGNNAEAYNYFTKVLELDAQSSEAWAGKAEAAGLLSNLNSLRFSEMFNYFENAIEVAPDEFTEQTRLQAGSVLARVITRVYEQMYAGMSPSFAEGNTFDHYFSRLNDILKAIDNALDLVPDCPPLLQAGMYVCSQNSRRVPYVSRAGNIQLQREPSVGWIKFLRNKEQQYRDALYGVDPTLEPEIQASTWLDQLIVRYTPKERLLTGVAALAVLILIVILLSNASSNALRSSNVPATTNTEDNFRIAARSFALIHQYHAKLLVELFDGPRRQPSLKQRDQIQASLQELNKARADFESKGGSTKDKVLGQRLKNLSELEQNACRKLLEYWDTRNYDNISNGLLLMRQARENSDALLKQLAP